MYPNTIKISRGAIHQWLWKVVPYPYIVMEEGMPTGCRSGTLDKESRYATYCVCSASRDIATRPFTILYIITALHVSFSRPMVITVVYLANRLRYFLVDSRSLQTGLVVFSRFRISVC